MTISHPWAARAIVVFAKEPVAGQVKTRLTPDLSAEEALVLYEAFVADVAQSAARAARHSHEPCTLVAAISGNPAHPGLEPFARYGFQMLDQGEGDLGERLVRVCREVFAQGVEKVLIVGTDSPTLDPEAYILALNMLALNDVVLGPTFDGGYYLVALNRDSRVEGVGPSDVLFQDIAWSTPDVLAQTWQNAMMAGLEAELLGYWYDVDTVADLARLRFHLLHYLQPRNPSLGAHTAGVLAALIDSRPLP